jgi:hypothetical protein
VRQCVLLTAAKIASISVLHEILVIVFRSLRTQDVYFVVQLIRMGRILQHHSQNDGL